MYNDLFTIGSFTMHGYGLMIAIGIILAYVDASHRAKRNALSDDHALALVMYCVIFGFLGAKILYWITILPQIIANPKIMLDFGDGFVVYGGIITGLLTAYIYSRRKHIVFLDYLDLLFPSVALAQGFGRIGCFLAGCCYGKETGGPLYIVFQNSQFGPNGVHLIPTQLISSAGDFLNYIVLAILYKKNKVSGKIAAFYLIFYSIGRFIIEIFRGDLIRGFVGVMSTSQFISIFTAAAGFIMLGTLSMYSRRKVENSSDAAENEADEASEEAEENGEETAPEDTAAAEEDTVAEEDTAAAEDTAAEDTEEDTAAEKAAAK